jgi:cell division septation protein DedD
MKLLLWNTIIIAASLVSRITAFSTGAGGCEGGAAVEVEGSPHLEIGNGKEVRKGNFEDHGIVVSIDYVPLSTSSGNVFPTGRDLDITVQATRSFKGILIRLERSDGKDNDVSIIPIKNTQDAEACQSPAIGITHMDSTPKSEASGSIRFDEEVSCVALDITVVFASDDQQSNYAHGNFTLVFQQSSQNTKTLPSKEESTNIISKERGLFQTNATIPSAPSVLTGQGTQWKPPTSSPVKKTRANSAPTFVPTTTSTLIEITRPPVNKNARVAQPTAMPTSSTSFFGSTTQTVNSPP